MPAGFPSLPAVNVNDEPVRVGQQKRRVLRHWLHIQHDACGVRARLRRTDRLQKAVVGHRKALARQTQRESRAMQIEEDAVGVLHARRLKLHIATQVNRDPRIRCRGPVPDPRHHRRCDVRIVAVAARQLHLAGDRFRIARGGCCCVVTNHLRLRPCRAGFADRPALWCRRRLLVGLRHHRWRAVRISFAQQRPHLGRLCRIVRGVRPEQRQRLPQRRPCQRARRVCLGKKLILPRCIAETAAIVQLAPLFGQQLSDRLHGARCVQVRRVGVVDRPVAVHRLGKLCRRMLPGQLRLKGRTGCDSPVPG